MKSQIDRFAVATKSLKGTLAVLCMAFAAQACAPTESTHAGTGGASTGSGTGGAGTGGASTSTGGTGSGTGGASTSTGGASTGSGTGGASTSTGGASTGSGTGGASTSTGGASTGSGTGGAAGGSTGTAALCTTEAKGGACTTSGQACGKTCGPDKKGIKLETCNGATYDEGACEFAPADYTCYKVSTTTAACPTGTMASMACTADTCMPCMGYMDSGGAAKAGYCVCGTNMKWSCGSDKEWPCLSSGMPKTAGGTGCGP